MLTSQGSYPVSSIMTTQQTLEEESTAFDTQVNDRTVNESAGPTKNPPSNKALPSSKPILMGYATPIAHVSAFCRSVLSTIIPDRFWGEGDTYIHNKGLFMRVINRFIILRRFETVSLHDAVQGMKVGSFPLALTYSRLDIEHDQANFYRSRTSLG